MRTGTAQVSQAWNQIAVGFDRYVTPTNNWKLPKTALHLAGLEASMRFLDVASGSGALSLPAARLGAEVLAVDISPVMIELLQEHADEERLSNLKGKVMDGHQLNLKDDTFDMTGSQFGVMLFPDFNQGLREMVRVTRPGGIVFLVVFGPPQKVGFISMFTQAIQKAAPGFTGLPTDPPPLPFQVSDAGVLLKKMKDAGLKNVRLKWSTQYLPFCSGDEMWDWVTHSNPVAAGMISGLDDVQKAKVRQNLDKMLKARLEGGAGAALEAGVHIAIGAKL